jgi:hypothetical protein
MASPDEHDPAHPPPRGVDGALPGFSRLDVAGYILALVLPLLGLIVGVIVWRAPRPQNRHGPRIVAISLVIGVLFLAALIATSHGIGTSEPE